MAYKDMYVKPDTENNKNI